MKIELKKLKIAEHMSEETTAFTADIYVDGKKAGYAKNDGHGGCTFYQAYDGKRSLIEAAEKFCETLPDRTFDMGKGRDPFVMKMNLEQMIDNLLEDEMQKRADAKFKKKLEKNMVNSIMWGVPNSGSYTRLKQKRPLSKYPLPSLQALIDKIKKEFKPGEVFLNTNFEELGVKL